MFQPSRRHALRTLGAGALLRSPLASLTARAQSPKALKIDVYKSPTCGCCEDWVKHLRDNGFTVATHDVEDTGVYRKKYGIPERFGSCHTGVINGYGIEPGNAPAFIDAAVKLASNPALIRYMGRAAHVGMAGLSPEAVICDFETLLREMAEENLHEHAATIAHA